MDIGRKREREKIRGKSFTEQGSHGTGQINFTSAWSIILPIWQEAENKFYTLLTQVRVTLASFQSCWDDQLIRVCKISTRWRLHQWCNIFLLQEIVVFLTVSIKPSPAYLLWCVCVQLLSCAQLFVTPWTVTCQASLSMGFYRREYWSGLPFPSPGEILWYMSVNSISWSWFGFYSCNQENLEILKFWLF